MFSNNSKKENNLLIKEEEPIIKNLCYDDETGKLYLVDNKNRHYLCDLFGRKKTKFLPNVTGFPNTRNSSLNYLYPTERSKTKIESSKFQSYYPTPRKFEGYMQFPRPLVPPFSNIADLHNKKKLLKNLNQYYTNEKSKRSNSITNENKGISYLTADINEFDFLEKDTNKILELINKTFEYYKEEYKYKMNTFSENPVIKALEQFRKTILLNKNSKIINGRKLKEASQAIKEKYKIIKGNNQKIKHKVKNLNILDNNDDLVNSKPLTFRKANKTLTHFRTASNNNQKKSLYKGIEIFPYDKKNLENSKCGDEDSESHLSFISKMSDLEKKYEKSNSKIRCKTMRDLKKRNENETNLLKGFKAEEQEIARILHKMNKPKLKTNGELFEEDMDLLRKTNPMAFKMLAKKNEYDLRQLKKKLNLQRINANNVMKGKTMQTKKENELEDNN